MRRLLFLLAVSLSVSVSSFSQGAEEKAVRGILAKQTEAWNRGDIEGFMQWYWKSDSLMFIGKNGLKWGWKETLQNYKKSYPDTATMGKLSFDLLVVKRLSPEYFYVVGKWMLTRSVGNISGHYDILLRKIKGKWVIIADHSS